MTQLVKREETAVQSSDVLQKLLELAQRKDVDPATVQAYLEMHRQMRVEERKEAFDAAMSRLQARMPQMDKFGQAKNSKFAKLEDIDIVIRPLLAEEGFSFSFDEESHTEKTVTFVAWLAHREGHREPKRLTVPLDVAAKNREGHSVRPAIQDAGSTVSYARRYLIKMHLNIIEKNEDTDGENRAPITKEQALEINTLLVDTKPADRTIKDHTDRFLTQIARVQSIEEITATDFNRVMNALLTKARLKQ